MPSLENLVEPSFIRESSGIFLDITSLWSNIVSSRSAVNICECFLSCFDFAKVGSIVALIILE